MFLIILLIVLEACMHVPVVWKYRRIFTWLLIALVPVTATLWIASEHIVLGLLIAGITLLRIVNYLRIFEARYRPERLLRHSRRVAMLSGSILLAVVVWSAYLPLPTLPIALSTVAIIQALTAFGLLAVTSRNLYKSHFIAPQHYLSDRELPTLTVAVPARNENVELEDCLHSLLANDYPKLEIIVLDDSSHDETPEIIRKFAHDGVRFVQGAEPDEHWLAKNLAYQHLLDESSGELILFCGVDTRFGPQSLRRIVTAMHTRNKSMMSIMPQRFTDSVAGAFVQPMRYWWQLALPRRLFDRPPVLSSCWIIRRKELERQGGFAAVSHAIIPEAHIARECAKHDGYSFIRSDTYLGVQTVKSVRSQRATTVRVRYPQLHKRLELAFAIALAELVLLFGPIPMLIYGIASGNLLIIECAGVALVCLVATHVRIVAASSPPSVPVSIINFPFAVLVELALGLTSVYKYEFSRVLWKGRTITPIRQEVIPHLPPLD